MKNFKVIDAFPFNGEFEMLKMRLDYLYDEVDYFFICESDVTQSGEKKDITYESHSHLLDRYKDKIIYKIYSPTKEDIDFRKNLTHFDTEDRFHLECKHRDYMGEFLCEISDTETMIMLSDVDEFPRKELFEQIWLEVKDKDMDAVSCKMRTFYYSPICELDIECFATTIINDYTLRKVSRFSDLRRYTFNCQHFEDAGWHLSSFFTPEQVQNKIKTYSHSEYNLTDITDLDNINHRMFNYLDILDRKEIKIIKHENIIDSFPIEFYRHSIFFMNTFDRKKLLPAQNNRKNASMQISLEIENLQLLVAKRKPKVIVEIGTANGGTLSRWFEIPTAEVIISLDHPHGIHGGTGFQERTYVISDAIEQANISGALFYAINGDSKDSYITNRLNTLLNGRKIDFLFIDGDHTYEGVKGDFHIYEQFLNSDAIVGFHDIIDSKFHRDAGCFVAKFWQEIKKKYPSHEFIYTNLLDPVMTPCFAASTLNGGFAGIGTVYITEKEKKDLITLISPIYNNVELTIENLEKTLESSKSIDELILYSNGTNDAGNLLLQNFVKKEEKNRIVKLIIEKKAIGFIKAVNNSIKLAKNELILCLNSDAVLYDNWESLLKPIWEKNENGLVGPILCDDFILGCCILFKKSVLNKVGLLNEGYGLGYYDDGDISDRVKINGYNLGFFQSIHSKDWKSNIISAIFPINHIQGASFGLIDQDVKQQALKENEEKWNKFKRTNHFKVYLNKTIDKLSSLLKEEDVNIVINYSGSEFEKIRYNDNIIKLAHIYECTPDMNIDTLVESICKDKTKTIIKSSPLTWLAKFDDYASMGILSQNIIQELIIDVSCHPIIGETETKNKQILDYIKKPLNHDIGIMFSAPDMYECLSSYKTKVIYTGVDTTEGVPNFKKNISNADFILTPSNKSKQRIVDIGVVKPIFVFPHGVNPEIFKYKERTKTDKFKFLYVGECSDRKGIFHLFEAFLSLFKDNMQVELHIKSNKDMVFYNGEEVTKIKKENTNIIWHLSNEGHDAIINLYNECHVYVYPSRADSFGMTLIEAMACGLPIISTSEPGSTELIENRFYNISSYLVNVENHPWMLGKWGEPSINDLKFYMKSLYENYDTMATPDKLKENSDFVLNNYSWKKVVENFEANILPKLTKKIKIITLLTSYNRSQHIENIINSLKSIREESIINDVYIVENSDTEIKNEIIEILKNNIDDNFKIYVSEINMGQRGALLQMLEEINIDEYDYIQFTDQDNELLEPLSTYCEIANENKDAFFVTGYMSKEHGILGSRTTRHGRLYEKKSLRAGHMFLSVSNFKTLLPIHLDSQYDQPHNSSWNAGLDWEMSHWNKNAPGRSRKDNFVLCLPGGVLHKGIDSTFNNWDVKNYEYEIEELKKMRYVS